MTEFNILIATELTDDAIALLQDADDVAFHIIDSALAIDVHSGLADAHGLIARDDIHIDSSLLDNAKNLKIIGRVGAGLSDLDIDAATERGVMVMNLPGVSAIAAGEHVIALMLALSRHLISAHNSLLDGSFDCYSSLGIQLYGKTMGIIGLGHVGKTVAQRCLAFGMNVLACDPYLEEDQTGDDRITLVSQNELLARSDFVSPHVPETANTYHLLNEAAVARMKPGACLINIAQGSVLDETALAQALKTGHLAGAAVDVYSSDPPNLSPLIGLENVVHTPHIAENTVEAAQDLSCRIAGQVLDALRGIDYRNVVNMPFVPGVEFEHILPYMVLAERMGTVLHVLARHPVRKLAVEYRGEELTGLTKPLTVALLKGLLTPVLGNKINYVNAPILARENDVQVAQTKGLEVGHYSNLVSCKAQLLDGEEIAMAGTLFDNKPHIVRVNEYGVDFVPEGHLLLMGSRDVPGVIGQVGMLLAENQVNIASWHTGRAEPGGNTLTVLTLDQPIPDAAFDGLCKLDFVRHARQTKI